jgi:transcription-repair coupling factor (superfamily II helicase)
VNPGPAAADELRGALDLARLDPDLARALEPLARPGGRAGIAGLAPPAAALLLPALLDRVPDGKILLLAPGEKEAEQFRSDLAFAAAALRGGSVRVLHFPPLEADPYQELEPHLGVACERVAALRALREPGPAIVVAPIRALILPLAPPAEFDRYRIDLARGGSIRPDDLSGFLIDAGYRRVDLVRETGEFSRRGGIVDFFPPEGEAAVRVEFWGEEVESIRPFDPATQRSAGTLERAPVPPVREYPWSRERLLRLKDLFETRRAARRRGRGRAQGAGPGGLDVLVEALGSGRTFPGFEACVRLVEPAPASLFDYAPAALLATWEAGQALSDLESVYLEMNQSLDVTEEFDLPAPDEILLPREALVERAARARLALFELGLEETGADLRRVRCAPPRTYRGRLQDLAADLAAVPSGERTLFLMETAGQIERLQEVLEEYGHPIRVIEAAGAAAPGAAPAGAPAPLLAATGRLSQGFELPRAGLRVLTGREIFGEHAEHETRRRKVAAFSPDFRDLRAGDLVVHVEHGIGRYAGIARVGEGEGQRDFMVLVYEGEDRLYVPVDRLDLVQRYSGVAGQRPHLDRLGGQSWERTRKKVKRAMEDMAKDLLDLYAARRTARGHAFSGDTPWQKELEDAFPYTVTEDQERAIREVKLDMESDRPMDRLICGDVGFGKTEVAMRAAFKAVMDGRQVAVLCPTTVLAFQHLTTFRERFSSWPVSIEMLSRFRSPREQKAILEAAAAGKIDVLIGTHRLLSKDVRLRDLGLLVVDEEQRFGVKHKEAIKALRKDVDVLTLTATPIPRTLQMSLAGIRDMSVITTPPENRLAIQTAVVPFREGLMATAVRNELKRGGQVYVVHNRVESIGSMAKLLRRLVPEARLAVAHGQMSDPDLERTMLAFLKGEFDVLLATTIIENGLDIPRVNTIVVNRADRFGLAQLYQLRGRVGRSDRRAYAYLMVPAKKSLTPVARRRLKALQEFTELGSGFRIAAMDLEIRGAGNLLGAEQSGHIAAVGFEMYCQLLDRTVREMKGEPPPPETRAQINLGVDIRIPETYIPDFGDRLVLYKKVSSAQDEREIARLREQMRDLYGEVPRQADSLLELAAIRLLADRSGVRSVDYASGRLQIRFPEGASPDPDRLVAVATGRQGASLTPAGVLRVEIPPGGGERSRIEAARALLQGLGPCASIGPTVEPSAVGPSGDR